MKHLSLISILISATFLLSACGSGSGGGGSSPNACSGITAIGSWYENINGDNMDVFDDCSGRGSYCAHEFTFTKPNALNETVVNISYSNNEAGCMSAGVHACTITHPDSDSLILDCGFGGMNYIRQ